MITFAYIDPGLGALAWQAIAAVFVGLMFYLKKSREWLAKIFQKISGAGSQIQSAPIPSKPERKAVPK